MTVSALPTIHSNGAHLVALDGRVLPLRSVTLQVHAGGGLAHVRVRQTFVNRYADPLSATYQLPLPADGAVVDFAFTVAGRRIAGRVDRRADARASFDRAVLEGRTAALLEQDRSSLFTQELGNLPPGAIVDVEIDVEQPLAWREGGWEWRFPTVVAPRFLGAAQTPDPHKVTVGVADSNPAIPCRVEVRVDDSVTGAPRSPSHPVGEGSGGVVLTGSLDRDVVLRWPVAAPQPGVRLEVTRSPGHGFDHGLLTVVPPSAQAGQAPVPRDLILLLDTSGSMGGVPLSQLQAFSRSLVQGLRDGDQLEMIEFSRRANRWRSEPVTVHAGTRAEALRWIDALRASGGTHMHEGIKEALRPLRAEALRQVVLVTDGLIGFESQIVGHVLNTLPPGCRLHTVGIGSAPNRSLTGPAARAGAGHEAIVGPDEPVGPVVAALLVHTDDPLVVDLTVSGDAVIDAAPMVLGDLMAGAPARIALRLRPHGGTIRLSGRTLNGTWTHDLQVAGTPEGRRVVATRWARERVEDLELRVAAGQPRGALDAEIESIGLSHRIATRMTSWVAETTVATVDPTVPSRHEHVPQALPHAMSAEGVGLRAPAASLGERSVSQSRSGGLRGVRRRLRSSEAKGKKTGRSRAPAPADKSEDGFDLPDLSLPADEPASGAFSDLFAEAEDAEVERAEAPRSRRRPAPSAAPPPSPPASPGRLRVPATVRLHQDGTLVLEVTGPVDWDATGPLELELPDGSRVTLHATGATTRPTALGRGQVARLQLAWAGPVPRTVTLRGLVLWVA